MKEASGWRCIGHKGHGKGSREKSKNTSPTSPSRTPTPHNNYGVAGEVGLALGWGCGLPEPLGICVAGYPDTSLRPRSMWSHPWANVAGYPDCSPQAAGYPGRPHRGLGAGPDRADARRSPQPHKWLELSPHV